MHPTARQQRGIELEARVFGGGPDEHDIAMFDMRQERILLGLVETVHLIDEQHGAATGRESGSCIGQTRAHSRQPRQYRSDRLKPGSAITRTPPGSRGL